ncbi:ABC transporter substrate-binding protein [Paenibacillus montanisoli]|uniref:ABC transporter substrate-binding protein n=2 Tax=Paenibacillus montanisoli TaxID=2081970 RepID=A0A328UCR0_9BACL|nr:ABC transporter substrate-binding protein [Paenibacillus montanisoli]
MLLAVLLVFSGVVACSKDESGKSEPASDAAASTTNNSATEQAEPEPLEPVTLKILVPGDKPNNLGEVLAEAEKRMADTLNVKLDMTFVGWADYGKKLQVSLAAGEDYDLVFDAPWNIQTAMIQAGYYEPLEALLDKYGPTIKSSRPEQMWEANKLFGKVYGIPLGVYNVSGRGYYIRKDLREKLGIPPIQTWDDFEKFLYAVKENEPKISPIHPGGLDLVSFQLLADQDTHIKNFWGGYTLYYKNNDGKAYNMFEERDPKFWEAILTVRKWFTDKIIDQDVLASGSGVEAFKAGKAASASANGFDLPKAVVDALKSVDPAAEAEFVTFFDKNKKMVSDFKQWNFMHVPVSSKNKERAIMFLNWANEKENYDLLAYGIEGKHWEAVGTDAYKELDELYPWFPYAWIWNPESNRENAAQSEEIRGWNLWSKDPNNFIEDKLTGFTFDDTKVKAESEQVAALFSAISGPLFYGTVDPEKTWEEYKEKAAPFTKKVQEEAQRQIDEFLQNKQ